MKLVHKMTGLLLLSACGVLGVYGYLTVQRDREMFEDAVIEDGRLIARTMRVSFLQAWHAEGREAALRLLADASASEQELNFRLISLVPGGAQDSAPDPRLREFELDRLRGGRELVQVVRGSPSVLRLYLPVELPDGQPRALLVAESLQKEDAHVAQTTLRIGVATLALIVVSGLVAFAIGSRIVGEPMRALMDKADRVGKGDLAGTLELRQSDEIGQLAAHMNLMCENLAHEIEERRKAQEQLRHAERLATVGELAAGIAHELGTPLNVVLGRAMMTGTSSGDREEVEENSRIIIEETERMIGIIRQLLDFARRGVAHKARRDLREIVRGVVDLLDPMASDAGVRLRQELPEGEVLASVDAVQIQQALMNILVNAIQATPAGGEVVIEARDHGTGDDERSVSLLIRDQGTGIPEDQRSRIFEPFFTTKDVGRGTGLGLPVAHGIVADHGGRIEVESEAGLGSRFAICLPAVEVAA